MWMQGGLRVESRDLYIKIEQNTIVRNKKVYLRDIAKMYCQSDPGLVKEAGDICVLTVDTQCDGVFVFSIMKIIDLIGRQIKNVSIVNLGEKDFVISYEVPKKKSMAKEYIKAVLVSLIIFFGSAFTIMTFNEDVSVGTVFNMVYRLFGAENIGKYNIMEITYSIGLALGIIVFFNHFSKKSTTSDPTPLQIEMRKYEKDIDVAIIADANREGKTKDV